MKPHATALGVRHAHLVLAPTSSSEETSSSPSHSTGSSLSSSLPDSSRIDFASRLARRASTAADGDGAGTSSSLLMGTCSFLRLKRTFLHFSLPYPPTPYLSFPFFLLPGSNFTHHGPTKFRQNRNQTIKTAKRIKESNTTSIPLIPSHSKMESKQSKSRENPGKSETLHKEARRSSRTAQLSCVRCFPPLLVVSKLFRRFRGKAIGERSCPSGAETPSQAGRDAASSAPSSPVASSHQPSHSFSTAPLSRVAGCFLSSVSSWARKKDSQLGPLRL
jgi:hypothetical protein